MPLSHEYLGNDLIAHTQVHAFHHNLKHYNLVPLRQSAIFT